MIHTFGCFYAVVSAAKCLVEGKIIYIWSEVPNPKGIFFVCIIPPGAAVVQFKSDRLKRRLKRI